ncbi:C3H1-type domain-containing protein [Mycena indigotica]|uniref:C3H1-type domain-containing protein n=1 Tax=Mycena indigotica TaxID=2126181 RepID=A0A8H6VTN7_9AGAR|nr:C3H1-type domain-containing protein [Mycena indigotica]KAF7293519.1 C3H1-type domain-containing protein [Mycena indigotica]
MTDHAQRPYALTPQQQASVDAWVKSYEEGRADRTEVTYQLTILLNNACVEQNVLFTSAILRPSLEQLDAIDNQRRVVPDDLDNSGGGLGVRRREQFGEEEPAPKRQRVDYAAFFRPTGATEEFLDSILPAKVLLVSARVQVYSEDIKEAVRHAHTSPWMPSFPPNLWKQVLLDQYVDFDHIRANTYATEPERPVELVLGETGFDVQVRKPKVVSTIATAGQWNTAFWIYSEAVNSAFQGRAAELQTYHRLINAAFASTH